MPVSRHRSNMRHNGSFFSSLTSRIFLFSIDENDDSLAAVGANSAGAPTSLHGAAGNGPKAGAGGVYGTGDHDSVAAASGDLSSVGNGLKDDITDSGVEEIRTWSSSFQRLLRNPFGRKLFRDFLISEYSDENIAFWLACEQLKNQHDPEEIENRARNIYEDYISIISPKEVSSIFFSISFNLYRIILLALKQIKYIL